MPRWLGGLQLISMPTVGFLYALPPFRFRCLAPSFSMLDTPYQASVRSSMFDAKWFPSTEKRKGRRRSVASAGGLPRSSSWRDLGAKQTKISTKFSRVLTNPDSTPTGLFLPTLWCCVENGGLAMIRGECMWLLKIHCQFVLQSVFDL